MKMPANRAVCTAFVAITGGLVLGAFAIYIGMTKEKEERLAKLDAQNKERLAMIEKRRGRIVDSKFRYSQS